MENVLYMAVTGDMYELPVAVFATIYQLSQWAEISTDMAYTMITRGAVRKKGPAAGCKFVRIKSEKNQ